MDKNRKTVRKFFTYLQCDDFADYLSKMAAQGWHFKEWSTGLVFEKGEPEEAVYAVEVFIHGSDYNLRPNDDTFNFADYCEEAGWKLIDAKHKYCIFKQIRPDAMPIVTPLERLENASKAYRGRLSYDIVLAVLFTCNFLLRFLPTSQLIDSLFSNSYLALAAFWIYYFIFTIGKCIWYITWVRKAKKRCTAGETKILNQANETFGNWISPLMSTILLVGMIAAGGPLYLILFLIVTPFFLIPCLLFAKLRPDKETFVGFQVVFPIILIITIVFVVLFSSALGDSEKPSADAFPLAYEDLNHDAGEITETYNTSSSSVFGETSYHSIQYKDGSLTYELYKTEHDWILDIIWARLHSYKRNAEPIDCTDQWNADEAYHNNRNEYFVRIGHTILVLDTSEAVDLTKERIDIILDSLDLEG